MDQSEKSSDNENDIKKLLNLGGLRKRKRISGSSESCAESNSSKTSSNKIQRKKKNKKSKVDESDMSLFSDDSAAENNQNFETNSNLDHFQRSPMIEPTNNDDAETHHRNMLLESSSNSNSDEECSPSPEVQPPKNKRKTPNHKEFDKENFLEEDCDKKKKKRKYDPLLHGKLTLSGSESEKDNDALSVDGKSHDQKYQELIEKNQKKREASRKVLKENVNNASDDEKSQESTASSGSRQKNIEGPVNFVSCDPECVEISEDNSDEDDCTTIGFHEISSSSESDDVQCIPQSQDTVASNKSGRKNIKKIISSKELTEESKKAMKEEEERRKRIVEKDKLLSQTFSAPEVEKLILDFDKDTKEELVTVHPALVAILKEHQVNGVKFMWNTCFESVNLTKTTSGSGCVLAHCMGLGKSLQVVTLVHTLINHPELNIKTALVMCPKSVVLNWGDEFDKWLMRVEELDPTSKKVNIFDFTGFDNIHMREKRLGHWQNSGGVMILSYATFRALVNPKKDLSGELHENIKKHLIDPGPDVIIFDEGHMLKNDSSGIHKAVDQVRTKRRIVLTGTPMQNNLMEYYFMINLVKRNYLGDKKEFSNRFFNPINNGQFKDSTPQDVKIMKSRAHVLTKKVDGIVNRYDSNVIEKLLPKRFEFVVKLRLTELQINLYKSFIDSLKNVDASSSLVETGREKSSKLMANERVLHYISNHPKLLKDYVEQKAEEQPLNVKNDWMKCIEGIDLDDVKLSSKTVLFFEILKKCKKNEDKLLVFSQHLKSLDLLEFFLKKASSASSDNNSENKETWNNEMDYFRLDGNTHPETRHQYCQVFNNPNNKRLRLGLLSTKAGGLGMNLIGANRAIIFDANWNPSWDSQSVYRIYRFGQEKLCYVYRFVSKGTMEEKKYHRQVSKLSTSSRVVDNRQVDRHFMEGHLRELYDYNFDYNENRSTPRVPPDEVLAELLLNSNCIENFEEHDFLLRNILDEELSEEDRRKAWEDYERERNAPTPSTASNVNSATAGPSGYTARNRIAAGLDYGSKNFSDYKNAYRHNFIGAPHPASNANSGPPRQFNHFAQNGSAAGMNYRLPKFPNNYQHVNNPGVNNAQNATPAQGLRNKIEKEKKDLKRKVEDLMSNNIIPLPYEPLKKPAPSNKVAPESAPGNKVSAGTTPAGQKNAEKVSQPEVNSYNQVNSSQNPVQNPQQRTFSVKPRNTAIANNQNSTSKKNTDQPGLGKPSPLESLMSGYFSQNNGPPVGSVISEKSVDPTKNVSDKEVSGNCSSADSLPHSAADKRTLPAQSQTTVHSANEADKNTATPPVDSESLNTIIEGLKVYVKAKINNGSAS